MKIVFCKILLVINLWSCQTQTILGNLSQLPNQPIILEGFSGLKTYPISTSSIDNKGNFKLTYSMEDYGVGYLISSDEKPLFVILSGEDIEIIGEALGYTETIKITKGQENQWFEQYAMEHPRRQHALSAWVYLEQMYTFDSLFSVQKVPSKAIQQEKERINNEDLIFLESLPQDSYVRWFLPTRKLVSSVSLVAQYRTDEMAATIESFRAMDYTDQRLYKSGFFKDAIDSHFWLLENSGNSLEDVFVEMQISIDVMMEKLVTNEKIFNELTNYLFDLLERQSLFQASEYLAIKVLNQVSCTIDNNLARQLETYRAMKKGNTAPDIVFNESFFINNTTTLNRLSEIKTEYTVVVFGASWCPKCKEELAEIAGHYSKWKSKGVEVVFIALEDDRSPFIDFAITFPFPSYSDNKKWESDIANDYYVFATPTMFLLDNKREIILRPNSVKQMDAWVDWNLK